MASRPNLILQTDSYKQYHWQMRIRKTTRTYSYLSTRLGAKHDWHTFYGLQYYLREYLEGPRVFREDIAEAKDLLHYHLAKFEKNQHFNLAMWNHIIHAHGGRLPLRVCAWDEGSAVPVGFPCFTVVNTDPACEGLTNHVEPLLAKVWYPMTVASLSRYVIRELKKLVKDTGGDPEFARYMLHDFGYRGASSEETARLGGSAHLIHANGTDTLQGMIFARDYYGADYEGLASSVCASEHSVMTAGGPQAEIEIAKHIILTHPGEIVSIVADSYNYYEFVKKMIELREFVDTHKVRLVIRPDSVTPQHPDPKDLVLWTLEQFKDKLPVGHTQTGHYLTHFGCLWGDGLEPDKILDIARHTIAAGSAAQNMVFGMGGGLLQKVNRDTERFALKSSAQEQDGKWVDIKKNPLDTSKQSLSGRMQVVKVTGDYEIVPEDAWPPNLYDRTIRLRPVFENGVILRQHTFEDVRTRARLLEDKG